MLFQRVALTFGSTLAVTLCFLCSCPCGSCPCCLFFCLDKRCHHRSAQPASLNGHPGQESQSTARKPRPRRTNSTCREPPCTPCRLRAGSCQHLHSSSTQCRSLTSHGGSSQTPLPSWFPGHLSLPSHSTLRLSTGAKWRKHRPNRCTRCHLLPGSSLLACSCPCCLSLLLALDRG